MKFKSSHFSQSNGIRWGSLEKLDKCVSMTVTDVFVRYCKYSSTHFVQQCSNVFVRCLVCNLPLEAFGIKIEWIFRYSSDSRRKHLIIPANCPFTVCLHYYSMRIPFNWKLICCVLLCVMTAHQLPTPMSRFWLNDNCYELVSSIVRSTVGWLGHRVRILFDEKW